MRRLIMLNGAFGVGKSTIAKLISKTVPRARVFDPEWIGFVLKRLPAFVPGSCRRFDDYQDSRLWRRLTVWMGSAFTRASGVTVMPMTLVRREYLAEIRNGLERAGVHVHHVCLTAQLATIEGRLAARGLDPETVEGRWVYPRAREACRMLRGEVFATHVDTENVDPDRVLRNVLECVGIKLDEDARNPA